MPSKLSKWLASYKPSSRESMDELIEWMYSSAKLVDDIEEAFEKLVSTSLPALQNFVILLLPSLLHAYLCHSYEDSSSVFQVKKSTSNQADSSQSSFLNSLSLLESCLLSICNCYISRNGPLKGEFEYSGSDISNFRLPSLTTPSVFHDPIPIRETIERIDANIKSENENYSPLRVSATIYLIQNYIETLSVLDLQNTVISVLVFHSLSRFSKFSSRIVSLSKRPRIPTSSSLLMVLLNCSDLILFKLDCLDKCSDNNDRPTEFIRSSIIESIIEISNRAAHHCFASCLLVCQSLLHYRRIYYGYRDRKPQVTSDVATRDVENVSVSQNGLDVSGQVTPVTAVHFVDDSTANPEYATRSKLSTATTEVFTSASFKLEAVSEDITPISEKPQTHKSDKLYKQENVSGLHTDICNSGSSSVVKTDTSNNCNNNNNNNKDNSRRSNRAKLGVGFRIKPSDHRKHHTIEKVVYTPEKEQ
ncbi:unnamed protein product [Heterobilharzia americana]|nr:unnamed protein product [Heterobilharzia americana]